MPGTLNSGLPRQVAQGLRTTDRHFGVDEAGRGAMAGPLAVAAVEYPFPESFEKYAAKVKDSKRYSDKARDTMADLIMEHCHWACVLIDAAWIDTHGIQRAETEGLIRSISELSAWGQVPGSDSNWPKYIFCDGTESTWGLDKMTLGDRMESRLHFMIKGDKFLPAISAASVIAKSVRDDHMRRELHERFPQYGFDQHVGYVTPLHIEMLDKFGSSSVHRHSFRPVRERDERDQQLQ